MRNPFDRNRSTPNGVREAIMRHTGEQLVYLRDWIDDDLVRAKIARQGDKILSKHNAHMFSQHFEDAMIAEIGARIGWTTKTFIEIGVESGEECNTRLLLALGWRGLWVEADPAHVARARAVFAKEIADGRLAVVQSFVTRENVQGLIDAAGLGPKLDFLSVDVDMNTSHVWRGIATPARAACIEYNANLPPQVDFEAPYDPAAVWKGDAWYGASLKRLEGIGRDKGMALVGCDISGVNAFFVADDLCGQRFLEPFDAETHWEPMRIISHRRGHRAP